MAVYVAGPLAVPVCVPSASVGGVLRSSVVVAGGLYGLRLSTFLALAPLCPSLLSSCNSAESIDKITSYAIDAFSNSPSEHTHGRHK